MTAEISSLCFLFSVPGETMGMAVLADAFIEVTGPSRTELSLACMFDTIASALLLPRLVVCLMPVARQLC